MKLYYFQPIGYGEEAIVMAESLERAKEYLLSSKYANRDEEYDRKLFDKMVNLRGYTIEEHGIGEVIFTEVS